MKKLLFALFGFFMLVGLSSCEKVSEKNLVGRWEMQKIEAGGEVITEDHQVWNFTEDHKMYISSMEDLTEEEYSGTWTLEGKTLNLQFIPMPVTVKKLNSKSLVLEGYYGGQMAFRYTFRRL